MKGFLFFIYRVIVTYYLVKFGMKVTDSWGYSKCFECAFDDRINEMANNNEPLYGMVSVDVEEEMSCWAE